MVSSSDLSNAERSSARRGKRERFSFAVNGAMFLFAAIYGAFGSSPIPNWSVVALLVLGVVQCASFVLALRCGSALPDRLANLLAAAGMAVSAVVLRHHHFLIPFLYSVAGAIKLLRAWKGPTALPAWRLLERSESAPLPKDTAPLSAENS